MKERPNPVLLADKMNNVARSSNKEEFRQTTIFEFANQDGSNLPKYPEADNQNYRKGIAELEATVTTILERLKEEDRKAVVEGGTAYLFIFADVLKAWLYRHEEWWAGISDETLEEADLMLKLYEDLLDDPASFKALLAGWVLRIPYVGAEEVQKVVNIYPNDCNRNKVGRLWCKVLLYQMESFAVAPENLVHFLEEALPTRGVVFF